MRTERWLSFGFGVFFVAIILAIAIFIPEPSDQSYATFKIVLALAAAGVGAVLPGALSLHFGKWLSAGGAIALFVIVFFFTPKPAAPMESVTAPMPTAPSKPAADAWLQMVDRGEYDEAYRSMAKSFRDQHGFDEVKDLLAAERQALGPRVRRALHGTSDATNPPGAPKGYYKNYGYRTRYANEARTIFEQVNLFWENASWRVGGFYTYVKNDGGILISYEPPDTDAAGPSGNKKGASPRTTKD